MVSDKDFYKVISDELAEKNMDPAVWTQAIALAEGDANKTQAAYIRLRLHELKKNALSQPATTSMTSINRNPQVLSKEDGLIKLRVDLSKKLNSMGKSSLYSILNLSPDASEAVIASAIADVEERINTGSTSTSAEFKYAKQTLSDPVLREQYDRKLHLGMVGEGNIHTHQARQGLAELHGGDSRIVPVVVFVMSLAILGYFVLDYFKTERGHEIKKEELEVAHTIVDIDQQKTQAEIDMQRQNMDIQRQNLAYQRQGRDEQIRWQQEEQERRLEMQREQQMLREQQAESMRIQREQQVENMAAQREQRYWTCINQQLSMPRSSSADAYARCSGYK